ncbi:MAG: multidrug resistance efflux transporter family protein, partial [Caldilineaceae bacterium]
AHWPFWTLAGGLGFGVFYTGITVAASWAPGWVVATTWQVTILMTPLVLLAFGRRVPVRGVLFALLIFVGILLVNAEQFASGGATRESLLLGVLPVLVAAVAYPAGMQLVWEARIRSGESAQPPTHARWIPQVDVLVLDQPFARVLLLVLGSLPWWVALWAIVRPPPPSADQWFNTALVALLSGIVATVLFMQARHLAHSPYELAAVDSTQAAEVLFSLVGEVLLLGGMLPGRLGLIGIAATIGGLVLYLLAQGQGGRGARSVRPPRGFVDMRWYQLSQ